MTDYKFNLPRETARGLFALCILGALSMHTIPALLAGLLSFVLTRGLLHTLRRRSRHKLLGHELLAATLVGFGSLAGLAGVIALVVKFLGGESFSEFTLTLANTAGQARQYLPGPLSAYVPTSGLAMQGLAASLLRTHANAVAGFGSHVLHGVVLTLIGWITGVLAAVSLAAPDKAIADKSVFYATWSAQWSLLAESFKNVAWAQAKIAGINASITGVFLLAIMPALGWHLAYSKTLVLATFLCGLLPVVGNLISNTFIVMLALSVAPAAAIVSLVFLVAMHKLEYFLNARIQGHEIGAKAWELLIVLFSFELLFGPAGMVVAPVIYAFSKATFKRWQWL